MNESMTAIEIKTWRQEYKLRCHTQVPEFSFHNVYDKKWEDELLKKPGSKVNPAKVKTLRNAVDQALDKGLIAGVAYDDNFLLKLHGEAPSMHYSSVVGRKPGAAGECLYRIRNSFGKKCDIYKKPEDCTEGYVWVNSTELLKHADTVLTVD